jgi:hypothetical protein
MCFLLIVVVSGCNVSCPVANFIGFSNVVNIYNGVNGIWSISFLSGKRLNVAATSLPKQGLAFFAGGDPNGTANAGVLKHADFSLFVLRSAAA